MRLPWSLVIVVLLLTQLAYASTLPARSDTAEYLVSYDSSLPLGHLVSYGCRVDRVFEVFGLALVECPKSIEKLGISGLVPNFEVTTARTDLRVLGGLDPSMYQYAGSSSTYTSMWSWAISRIGADIVWSYLKTMGEGVVIAVLDTGVDPEHPLLYGKLITADPRDPSYPGGWIEFDSKGRPVCSKPRDLDGHGTWVSSILVGGDGSTYIFGVLPQARIMVASVLPAGYGTAAQVLAGLEWVLRPYDCNKRYVNVPKPHVVSMSLGALGNYSNVFVPAIRKLIEAGIVPIAAIGNGGPYITATPGNIWGVIGVGATDFNDELAYFSSYEEVEWPSPPSDWPFKGMYPRTYTKPDIVAPGVYVAGAFPGGLLAIGSGTSAATPLVAGVAAAVSGELRKRGFEGPALVEAVYDTLTSTALHLGQAGTGYGRVRAYLAVSSALGVDVTITFLGLNPTMAEPGKSVRVTAGVGTGRAVDVYISGIRVFSGSYTAYGITATVPYTHLGGNTVVLVSSDGSTYGEALLAVSPAVQVERNLTSGFLYRLVVSGLGIADSLAIYVSDNIIVYRGCDLRGTLTARFIAPYVNTTTHLQLLVRDLSRPLSLSTLITITPPALEVRVVEYEISVNSKSHYVVGKPDTLEVLLPSEDFKVSITQIYPDYQVLKVLKISLEKNLAVFLINVTDYPAEGVVFVHVTACRGAECTSTLKPLNVVMEDPIDQVRRSISTLSAALAEALADVESFKILTSGRMNLINSTVIELKTAVGFLEGKLSEVSNSLRNLATGIASELSKINNTISYLDKRIAELRVEDLKSRVGDVESSVKELGVSLRSASEDIGRLERMVVASLLVAVIAVAVASYSLIRSTRRSPTS